MADKNADTNAAPKPCRPNLSTDHDWVLECARLSDGSIAWDVVAHDSVGNHRVRIACTTYEAAETLCENLTRLSVGFEVL